MRKQTYWDCKTISDDVKRKAYVKDGRQRIKTTRTITTDCATGITEGAEAEAEGTEGENDLVTETPDVNDEANVSQLTVAGLRELFRSELVAWSTGKAEQK
jgi:hypothetical protein